MKSLFINKLISIALIFFLNVHIILVCVIEIITPFPAYSSEVECSINDKTPKSVTLGMDFVKDDKAYCYLTKSDGSCYQQVWEMDLFSDSSQCEAAINMYIDLNTDTFKPQTDSTYVSKQWKDGTTSNCKEGSNRVQKTIELLFTIPASQVKTVCPLGDYTCYAKPELNDSKYYCTDTPTTTFCMKDLNGDGNISADEYQLCQNNVCPLDPKTCNAVYTCPLGGDYPCNNGACIKPGTCLSGQEPYDDFLCSDGGLDIGYTSTDSTDCNSHCRTSAACGQVCPLGDYPCANGSCTQAGSCASVQVPYDDFQCPVNGITPGYTTPGNTTADLTACDNNCVSYTAPQVLVQQCKNPYTVGCCDSAPNCCVADPTTIENWISPSKGYNDFFVNGQYKGKFNTLSSWNCACDTLTMKDNTTGVGGTYGRGVAFSFCKNVDTCTVASGITSEGITYYYCTNSTNSIACPDGYNVVSINGVSTCKKGAVCVTHTDSTTQYQCSLTGAITDQPTCTSSCYTTQACNDVCPLQGGSACDAQHTCTAGSSCIGHTSYTTKWQCDLTGTKYLGLTAESDCTTACYKDATCQIGSYSCPLGDSYACNSYNGQQVCNDAKCMTNSQAGNITTDNPLIDGSPQPDGQVDPSTGKCLGTLYIFPGKAMSCRDPGLKTSWKNCCDKGNVVNSGGGGSVLQSGMSFISYGKALYGAYQAGAEAVTAFQALQSGYGVVGVGTNSVTLGVMSQAGTVVGQTTTVATTAYEAGQTAFAAGTGAAGAATTGASQSLLNALIPSPAGIAIMIAGYIITQLFMQGCNEDDIMTSTYNESRLCHEVPGEKCVSKMALIGCVQTARVFCCFSSKLARIINEGGRPQLNMSWGDGETPSCRGFTPEELQAIDFSKIDFSEYVADVTKDSKAAINASIKGIQDSVNSMNLK